MLISHFVNTIKKLGINVELDDFLKNRGDAARMAEALKISESLISYYRTKKRRVPPEIAMQIENYTGGAVTRKELCPDIWELIWPELTEK